LIVVVVGFLQEYTTNKYTEERYTTRWARGNHNYSSSLMMTMVANLRFIAAVGDVRSK
jgi:hypothetical protein